MSGFLVEPLQKLLGLLPWSKLIDMENWEWLFKPRFSILSFVIFLVLWAGIFHLFRKLSRLNRKNRLKKFNSLTDHENAIKVTWDVGIGQFYSNDPFAYNIKFFCLKHGLVPKMMIGGRCVDPTCPNHHASINEYIVKNEIESRLLHLRDKKRS